MKQFVKFIFASCFGTLLAMGVLFLVLFAIGAGSAPKYKVAKNSVLELKFDQFMPELTDNVVQGQFSFNEKEFIGLNDVRKLIRHAAEDDHISGILLKTESVLLNPTAALTLSNLMKEFAESGKFVWAYGNYFTQSGYLLASAADSIALNPNGIVDMRGFGMLTPYLKSFSEKTGIDFDVYYAGKYKSAVEPFYLSESSEANRFQTMSFLNEYQRAYVTHISKNRPQADDVMNVIVEGLSNNAMDALDLGLVDELAYWSDFEKRMEVKLDDDKINYVDLQTYKKAARLSNPNHDDRVAVLYAEGDIGFSGDQKGVISMERYGKILDRIKNNKRIKALVLRVNSPGGSSFTSDVFWKKIEEIKKDKVVIASFGNYAASGGYYISAGADKIVSEPTTLTGSIGVFSMIPDMNELFTEKLGINWDTIGTGKRTFMYSSLVSRSDDDNLLLMNETERIYAQFKNVVAQGRDLSTDEIEEVAQGRVWSGRQAVQAGLVDTLGSLDDAIAIAASEAGLDEYKILEYPVITKTFYEQLLTELMAGTETRGWLGFDTPTRLSRDVSRLLDEIHRATEEPQARLPFHMIDW